MTPTYNAAICTALEGPDAVRVDAVTRRPLAEDEVRIRVMAAGLNFPDLLMTRGLYQHRPNPPFIPGMEVAGEVIEKGKSVASFRVGDRVSTGGKEGAFAQEFVTQQQSLHRVPDTFSFEEAACWSAGARTAWHALHDKAAFKAGESLLVLGASGGVGMAAVKLGRHLGGIVIGTGSSPEKRTAVLAAGADYALDPAADDLAAQVKALTGGGADVVFDPVGGDLAITATRAIGWGGRYLIVGFASGTPPHFPANHALIKGYGLIGLRAGEASRRDPALAARTETALAPLAEQGIMRPHICARFALKDTADALRLLETRTVIGRAVILPHVP